MSLPRCAIACRGALATAALLIGLPATSWTQGAAAVPADSTNVSTYDLERLLQVEVVVAGSKRAQRTRDVPSYVSVVTASEIEAHGYRTLADVLRTLPSFYITNDRNYSYVGVRGFARPGDYSTRILLLVDGLRTNDNVYDQALVGEEFVVDVDLIERIEVIRGPSAALYGSNAFFAVINVVTKEGRGLHGAKAVASAGSFGAYSGGLSYGRDFAEDLDVLVSASYSDTKGRRLYFPEFDSPSTNNGIANEIDRESSLKLFANVDKGDLSFRVAHSTREKGVPTASYSTIFNDPRSQTTDGLTLASLGYSRLFGGGTNLSTRVHAGRWTYLGEYAYDPSLPPNRDDDVGEWWGADVDASRPLFARHFVTVGAEYRDNLKQHQRNFDPEPYAEYIDLRNASTQWGLFAQDEIRVLQPLALHAGVRYDRDGSFGSATSPRVGLIYTPDDATTLKLLAGRAFRAPNDYEMFYETAGYRANPDLQPERIETLELVAQRFIGSGVQITAAGFRNRLSDLITQRPDPNDGNRLVFDNSEEIESKGIELGLDVNRGHGPTGQLTYALQRTEDRATGSELSNSPRHMVKVQVWAPVLAKRLSLGLDAQYLSGLRTLTDHVAPGRTVTNVSLFAPDVFGLAVNASIYNCFDTRYGNPGSEEHAQDIIQQDGRSFRVKTTLHR